MSIRVAVADDQALVRTGLCGILDSADDLEVVGQAADGAAAVDLARDQDPDVILMDIRMPVMDGLEATRIITRDTATRVLVLTTFDHDEYILHALRAGASGFLVKDTPVAALHEAVRIVAAGEALLAPTITRRVIDHLLTRGPATAAPSARLHLLTTREHEVLDQIAEGASNAEIASALHITHGTVKTHVSNLLTKLDARDRIQLVILARDAAHTADPT